MEPSKGYAARITAPCFRATDDGFLVWGSFPRLVRTEGRVNPGGLPRVLSRLALALLISGFIPLNSFGRWEAQSAPTPRTSSILTTRLVQTFKVTIFGSPQRYHWFLWVQGGWRSLLLLVLHRGSRDSCLGDQHHHLGHFAKFGVGVRGMWVLL